MLKAGIPLFQTFKNLDWTPVSTGVTTFYDSISNAGLEEWNDGRLDCGNAALPGGGPMK